MDVYTLAYKTLIRPSAFRFDAEAVHDFFAELAKLIADNPLACKTLDAMLHYKNGSLHKIVEGIEFENPIGLAAGFDYDGKFVSIMKNVGFGFNTVGTVTARPYGGNKPPHLVRLPKSHSILVNKGFKNEGVHKIAERLNHRCLGNTTFGVSVGSSNVPKVNSIEKAIDDYVETFSVLEKVKSIKYYELNISCPNTDMTENFVSESNFELLLKAIRDLSLCRPVFVKMPNEIDTSSCDALVRLTMKSGINAFIFSNLAKSRANPVLARTEIEKFGNFRGNFSGLPTKAGSLKLLKTVRKKYGDAVVLIGCGGVFSPQDALERFLAGADLVQLITGMIYEGPGLIGNINKKLAGDAL